MNTACNRLSAIFVFLRARMQPEPADSIIMADKERKPLNEKERQLYEKIQEGAISDIKTLLDDRDVRIDCLDEHGMTPLQHAAYKGSYEMCKLLLDRGADVNSNHHDSGYTALMFAALTGKLDVVALLLENGASTTAVNTVGRNASQMAAFVGNHEVVSVITNFISREEIDYYTEPHGLETEPKLLPHLAAPLHKLTLKTNVHPVKLAMFLQDNLPLLAESKKVVKVLELLCEKEMKKSDSNEMLALKFHHLAFVVKACAKMYEQCNKPQNEEDKSETTPQKNLLEPLIKTWIRGRESDGFPVTLEKFLRQCVREFPYHECIFLQQIVRTLAPVEVGDEPSAISILEQAISGHKSCGDVPVCATCGEPNAEKRCAACKSVQYCDPTCQKLHWFSHKKQCPKLAEMYKKTQAEKQDAKESKQDEGVTDSQSSRESEGNTERGDI